MSHQEANDAEREYHLGIMHRELVKVEQAITEAEARKARMAAAGVPEDMAQRFPALKGDR
ncbi:hypothetical protein [Amycolatopsis tucumanensis]|uniref:Uncharacterized protein n=1 Tax=Amycolatopsis tucumanensis TaxID=401106 RepID=A0ABP7IXB3_9PSEU|nr:hypothetical protein [Amycolatopsis tucumanensis]MCF6423351.1 hypothetical protein [Amycolatopsis tucumanensis]